MRLDLCIDVAIAMTSPTQKEMFQQARQYICLYTLMFSLNKLVVKEPYAQIKGRKQHDS
jgi:hypothetical protein